MIRQQDNIGTHRIQGANGTYYFVTMEKLRNTNSGNPRWRAIVTPERVESNAIYRVSKVFIFTGHYYNEYDEASWIVAQMLKN